VHSILMFFLNSWTKVPSVSENFVSFVNKTYIFTASTLSEWVAECSTLYMSRALDRCHVTELSSRSNLLTIITLVKMQVQTRENVQVMVWEIC
jgi:hypothetical protein